MLKFPTVYSDFSANGSVTANPTPTKPGVLGELYVQLALGTPPRAVQRMVVYETLALMLLASALGYGLGIALVLHFGRTGIDLSGFFAGYSAIPGLTGVVHPMLLADHIGPPGVLLFVASVMVSMVPATKAARLDPVRAIRHV